MSQSLQKRCTKCGEHKPRDMFGKNKTRKDGLSDRCNPCRAAYRAAKAQWISEYNKAYKQANSETIRQYNHDYHAAHAESIHEGHRAYKRTHAKRLLQYSRTYYAAHPDIYIASAHRRRARIKSNGGTFTPQQIRDLYHAQEGYCAYCGRRTKLTIDHIIPIKQGGSNDISNICLACRRCNLTKHAKTPQQWVKRWYEQTDE